VGACLVEARCLFDKLCSMQSLDAKAQRRRPEGGSTREATALRSIVPGAPIKIACAQVFCGYLTVRGKIPVRQNQHRPSDEHETLSPPFFSMMCDPKTGLAPYSKHVLITLMKQCDSRDSHGNL